MMTTSSTTAAQPLAPRPVHQPAAEPTMGNVLRAVIRKELQQNWINLALVICIDVIVTGMAVWFRGAGLFYNDLNILTNPAVRSVIPIICILTGFLLGVLQPLADRNFDLWAFLTHRPVPRLWLFYGRIVAGIILYSIVVGLPVGILLVIAPTNYAGPLFLWRFAIPPLAYLLLGILFYFAGLLVVERRARLQGSRLIPILAALALFFASEQFVSAWPFFALTALLLSLYIPAAAGASVSHGYTLRSPCWTRVALALILLSGLSALIALPAVYELRENGFRRENILLGRYDPESPSRLWSHDPAPIISDYYSLAPDATLIHTTATRQWNSLTHKFDLLSNIQTDPAGHPVREFTDGEDWQANQHRQDVIATSTYLRDSYAPPFDAPGDNISIRSALVYGTSLENVWYWVAQDKVFYVYQQPAWNSQRPDAENETRYQHKRFLGVFGADGLQPSRARAQPLAGLSFYAFPFVASPAGLSKLDFERISLVPYFNARPGEIVRGVNDEQHPVQGDEGAMLVLTNQRFARVDFRGNIQFSLPLPANADIARLNYAAFPDKHLRVLWWRHGSLFSNSATQTFLFFDDAGQLLDNKTVTGTSAASTYTTTLLPKGLRYLHRFDLRIGAITGGSLPAVIESTYFYLRPLVVQRNPGDPRNYALELSHYAEPYYLLATALPLMLAYVVIAWLLTRAYAITTRMKFVWPLLALVVGPAAPLTLIALHHLPQWRRCMFCRRFRLLQTERCQHCRTPWPAPASTGTEIFDASPHRLIPDNMLEGID